MPKRVRLVWNKNALTSLRTSKVVADDLSKRAERIASAAGDGFVANNPAWTGNENGKAPRYRTSVAAESFKAKKAQSKDNVLQRAMNAGR
jgi:hypothetical protein